MTTASPFVGGRSHQSRDVLVVDDDLDVAETTALYLREHADDLTTAIATSADDGLEHLDRTNVDCIVSDYRMPGRDGLELLDAVRDHDETVPFILFTAHGSETIASEAISAGVTDYLQKGGLEKYELLANRVEKAIQRADVQYELERTRARFRALTENASFAVVTIDANSTIQYANQAFKPMFGYDPEELVGESLSMLIPDRLQGQHYEAIDRYLETGERHLDWGWIELPAERTDGTEMPVGITFGERTTDDGEHLFTGIIRDITERNSREQRLQEERDRFKAIFENAHDPIFILDPESLDILNANPAAAQVLGYSRDELLERSVEDMHPDDYPEVDAFAEEVRQTGEGRLDETYCYTKDGEEVTASLSGSIVEYDGEERLLVIVRPKTE